MSRRLVFWSIGLLAVAAAFAQAWGLRWTCDDAYISFRYAEHFASGHGLVFNRDPTEAPVEGYTNFAWTMWLALGMALGFTRDLIEGWAAFWGACCHAGTVFLLAALSWRASGGRAAVPIAACAFAGVHHAASLAPAGLETAMFTLLVTAVCGYAMQLRCVRDAWLLGFLGVLLAMTRPDGGLFVAIAGLFVLYDARVRRAPRLLLAYVVPFAIAFVPYLIWRWLFYGYLVPNTFYAKSASDPYPSQGLVYVWEFFKCYWALLPVVLLPMFYLVKQPDPLTPVSPWLGRRPHLGVLAFVLSYAVFVVWVGGDFMFGRFLVPVLPVLLLGVDFAANRWRAVWWQPLLAIALVAGAWLRVEPAWIAQYANRYGFSDNRQISLADSPVPGLPLTEAMRLVGHRLREIFDGLDVAILIVGSQANLAYRTGVPVAIEGTAGLTDVRIAHQEIGARGTVAHEKGYRRQLAYLVDERRVQINFDRDFAVADVTNGLRDIIFDVPEVGPMPGRLMIYDRDLMNRLAERQGVAFFDFEQFLDDYIATLDDKTKPRVRKDLAAFRTFYFDHNDDPDRLRRLEAFIE